MLNAMLNVIITEKLYDEHYIAAYTENFEALKANIAQFTPEKMAPVCGIDAHDAAGGRAAVRDVPALASSSGAWASASTCTAPTTRAA